MAIIMPNTELQAGYKQTELGVIPEDWKIKTIGESFDIDNHLRYPISQDIRKNMIGLYPYYGPTKAQGYINEYRVKGEYALIGEDGDHFLKWRESPMTLLVNGKFNVNNHAHLVKGIKNLTSWFYYYFQNKDLTQYLTRQGAGRYKLTKNTLITILCPLPSLEEQKAIASALSDVDALITSLDKLITKKRGIKQATMQQLLTGKTRLPGFSGEWEIKNLKDVGICLRGVSYNGENDLSPYDTDNTIRLLRANNVQNAIVIKNEVQFVISTRVSIEQILQSGDILICTANGSKELVGKAGTFKIDDIYNYTFGAFMACFRTKSSIVDPTFVFFLFQTNQYRHYISNLLAGSSINNLKTRDIESLKFFFPSLEEQKAITTVLSDMDAEIVALEQKRDKTRALKQGMMQELLTGKTRLL